MLKTKLFVILLALLAFLVACGPPPQTAAPDEEAHAEPETAEVEIAPAEEVVEPEQPEVSAPAAPKLTEFSLEVLEPGSGDAPQPGDYVKVHFIGSLADGTEFANSYEIGEPLVYPFGRSLFFEGWDLALSQMTFGEKVRVEIPSAMAFGEQGAGVIPPNSDLYFEMELVDKVDIAYEEVEAGSGAQAQDGDTVRVHYVGKLDDGTEFDNSYTRGEPIEFVLGQGFVIPGWEIGILKMKEGGKAILTIPPELGYGSQGAGGAIPPNATLTFEVELVSVGGASE